jgi:hypothetical protein
MRKKGTPIPGRFSQLYIYIYPIKKWGNGETRTGQVGG